MPLKLDIAGQNGGGTQSATVDNLVEALQAKGEQVLDVSPDGMSVQVAGMKGPITVPIQQAAGALGFQIQNMTPLNPDYSGVSPKARAAITAISGEDNKIAYLKMLEQRRGNLNPQIMGSGRDFFVFDPEKKQYRALTNNPDWDVSDLAEAGAQAPGAVGAVIGGGFGAAVGSAGAGVGSVPGLMAGSAVGSTLGNSFTKIALGIQDPDARKAMMDSPWRQAGDVAGTAALDAASAGIGSKLPGLASSAAKGAGRVVSNVGRVAGHGAKMLDNDFGREAVGTLVNPYGQGLATAELAMKAPAAIGRAANRFPGWVGQKMEQAPEWLEKRGVMDNFSPETQQAAKDWFGRQATNLKNYTNRLTNKSDIPSNPRGEAMKQAESWGNWMGGKKPASPVTLEDEWANLGEYMGGGKQARDIYHAAEKTGFSPRDVRKYARTDAGTQWGLVGAKGGRLAETLDAAGDLAGGINRGIGAATVKGIRGAGVAANAIGDGMRYTGALASPLENRYLTRYGSEEALRKRRPWQMTPNTSTINPTQFASEE